MTDDLVKRLRDETRDWIRKSADRMEAADRIKALTVERDKAREYAVQIRIEAKSIEDARVLAVDEAARLREAIDYILDGMGIYEPDYVIDPEDDFLDVANSKWVRDTLERLASAVNPEKESSK